MKYTKRKKRFLKLLKQNKKTILAIVLLSAIVSTFYAYTQRDIYESISTVDIKKHSLDSSENIVDSLIDNHSFTNKNTEVILIKSRAIIENILEKIDIKHHYFIETSMKEKELYKASPFEVDMVYGEGIDFYITATNHQYYTLEVEGIDSDTMESWHITKMYVYGKPAQEKHFLFTLDLKEGMKLKEGVKYHFFVLTNNDTIDMVQKNLMVISKNDNSSIIQIKYRDTIPSRSKDINDAIIEEYLAYNIKIKTLESSRILAFIDEQISGIDGNINKSKKKLNGIKKKEDLLSLSYNSRELLQKVDKYNEELSSVSEKLHALKILYEAIKKGKIQTTLGDGLSSPALERLLERYSAAIYKRKRLRVDYTMAHPAVKSVTKSIRSIKNSIFSTIKTLRFRIEKRKKKLLKLQKKYNQTIKDMPEKEKIYGDIKRKFIVNEKIYGYFLEKRAMAAIAKASAVNQIRVVDKAIIPNTPIEPNRLIIIMLGVLFGILLSILYILLKEYIDDSLKTEDDIRESTSLPLLGTIPKIKEEFQSLKVFDSPKSLVAESFRALRTNLQFIAKNNKNIVVAITSTVGGEGKTTVSSNLAGIISLRDKKVIILNMDMRKPTLHQRFGLSNTIGMSTLLSSSNELNEVIQNTKYENIDIIASGPVPPNPSELIENEIFEKILKELKKQYDVIILDTPPVGLVTDAMCLMKLSDITLYVLRAKYSKKVFLQRVERLSQEHRIKGLNLVLNGLKNTEDGYGYYEE